MTIYWNSLLLARRFSKYRKVGNIVRRHARMLGGSWQQPAHSLRQELHEHPQDSHNATCACWQPQHSNAGVSNPRTDWFQACSLHHPNGIALWYEQCTMGLALTTLLLLTATQHALLGSRHPCLSGGCIPPTA